MTFDRADVLRTFFAESRAGLEELEQALFALEASPRDRGARESALRVAHTLKGNALSLGFEALGRLAHALEERLAQGDVAPLFAEVDGLRREVAALESGNDARTLRIGVEKLDRLLDLSGELSVALSRLRAGAPVHDDVERHCRELQASILDARAIPAGPVLAACAHAVREAAQASGKRARLRVEAEGVEVDTAILDRLRDPLMHLVRNAVAHGLERPEVREARGKDPVGTVTLRARREHSLFVLEVADDGNGFDPARIAEAARARGLAVPRTEEALFALVFRHGFSTAAAVDGVAGRGVGMDAVRHEIERLRGEINISSSAGKGATIALRLPLTLAIVDAFLVGAGGAVYAIPLDATAACGELPQAKGGMVEAPGGPVPVLDLAGQSEGRKSLVLVEAAGMRAALSVDRLEGARQTIVKPLEGLASGAPGISGTALLGDGRIALMLDVRALLSRAASRKES